MTKETIKAFDNWIEQVNLAIRLSLPKGSEIFENVNNCSKTLRNALNNEPITPVEEIRGL